MLIGLIILFGGIILLLLGHRIPAEDGGDILLEASYVIMGTVTVSFVYEYVLSERHERKVFSLLEDSILTGGPANGLIAIDKKFDYCELFRDLESNDELLWLDTYCPGRDFLEPLREALERGARVRMLAVDPSSVTALLRGGEMKRSGYTQLAFVQDVRGFINSVEGVIGRPEDEGNFRDRATLRLYSDLPCIPMYIVCRNGSMRVGWTSYFLSDGSFDIPHLQWAAVPDGLLSHFRDYFEAKWHAWESPATPLVASRSLAVQIAAGLEEDQLTELLRDILQSRYGGAVAELATRHGWYPIVHAGAAARRRNLDYRAQVTGPVAAHGTSLYSVEVAFASECTIGSSPLWVSFAQNVADLRHEFAEPSCVARELVDVSPAAWADIVSATETHGDYGLSARVRIQGMAVNTEWEFECVRADLAEPVVRLKFAVELPHSDTRLEVRSRFFISAELTQFPVRFPSYFCLGQTTVEFSISDSGIDRNTLDAYVSFAGDVALDPMLEGIDREQDMDHQRISIRTSDDVVLWPGSGIVFVWRRYGPGDSG
ncbi:MAG: hypothetical protein M3256_17495 [Actinomycetota bacterium]|nr:hypothetical protein [Actinomycetota bacterium]